MDLESVIGEFRETFDGQAFPAEISERFHVTERLGNNVFGETFLMSEKDGGELFVLKRCRKSDATAANEAEILRGLKHEGLPVYDGVIESDTEIFVSRRYIKGITLAKYIEKGDTADKELIVDTMIALCGILEFLHSQPVPIIHRDIKPSNIIINLGEGTVSLIDFGISRKYSEDSGSDTMCLGTRNFAPPEQYGFAQTDCRSDIYSLGVVLRYWLTGSSGRYAEIDDKVLARIVAKGTMLDPEMRYGNIADLKKELDDYRNRATRRVRRDYSPGKNDVGIRNISARELVGRIGAGWNLGNTFDARNLRSLGDNLTADISALETAWVAHGRSAIATRELVEEVRRTGFDGLRIPVNWTKVADPDNGWAIRPDWMARIEEVVGWAYGLDMFVILNAHHEYVILNQMVSNPAESERILARLWEQIAGRFNNRFGERLIFEGANNHSDSDSPEGHAAFNRLNQVFVDTVRATGGNNTHRTLMLMAYKADVTNATLNGFELPADPTPDRLILSLHANTPPGFIYHDHTDTWSETGSDQSGPDEINNYFRNIERRAKELGNIPVVIAAWSSNDQANTGSRAAHAEFLVREATARGWPTFWWDNSHTISNGGTFQLYGLIDRRTHEWHFPEIVDAIMRGAGVNH